MKFSYNGLWKNLIDKNIMKTELQRELGISVNTLSKMGKNSIIFRSINWGDSRSYRN